MTFFSFSYLSFENVVPCVLYLDFISLGQVYPLISCSRYWLYPFFSFKNSCSLHVDLFSPSQLQETFPFDLTMKMNSWQKGSYQGNRDDSTTTTGRPLAVSMLFVSSVIQNMLCPQEVSCLLVGEAGCNFSLSRSSWMDVVIWKRFSLVSCIVLVVFRRVFVEEYNGFLEVALGPCCS